MISKIAIYGWAFDPPHQAHEQICKTILDNTDIEKIIIVPTWSRPDKIYKVSESVRKKVLRLFMQSFHWYNVELCEDFMNGNSQTTEVGMDEYFTDILWEQPVHIMWADTIPNIDKWYEPEKVRKQIEKIMLTRKWYEAHLENFEKYRLLDIDFKNELLESLSSTKVREQIKNGDYSGLNPKLANFLKENNIYK